jgi:hypothetical protein
MVKKTDEQLNETKRLMGALLRMPPKPHEDMKLGGRKPKKSKLTKAKRKT